MQYNVTIMFLVLSLSLSSFIRFKWGLFPLSFILFLTFYYLSQGCKDNIKLDIQQFCNFFLTQYQKPIALFVASFYATTIYNIRCKTLIAFLWLFRNLE